MGYAARLNKQLIAAGDEPKGNPKPVALQMRFMQHDKATASLALGLPVGYEALDKRQYRVDAKTGAWFRKVSV